MLSLREDHRRSGARQENDRLRDPQGNLAPQVRGVEGKQKGLRAGGRVMETKAVTLEQRDRMIRDFVDRVRHGDSIVVTIHQNVDGKNVVSETLTFVHPNHVTAAKNTLLDLVHNLTVAQLPKN